MRTSVQQFADLGNPWATEQDWTREVALAQNPKATTHDRDQALAYVRPAEPFTPSKKLHPRDYPVVNADKLADAKRKREFHQEVMRLLDDAEAKPIAVAPIYGPRFTQMTKQELDAKLAEPITYEPTRPLITDEEIAASTRAHKLWRLEQLRLNIAALEKSL